MHSHARIRRQLRHMLPVARAAHLACRCCRELTETHVNTWQSAQRGAWRTIQTICEQVAWRCCAGNDTAMPLQILLLPAVGIAVEAPAGQFRAT